MTPSISVIISTTGLPSLRAAALSVYHQLGDDDHLYVVFDSVIRCAHYIVEDSFADFRARAACTIMVTGRAHWDHFTSARNLALSQINGGWAAYLDEGQTFRPDALTVIREAIKGDPSDCGFHIFRANGSGIVHASMFVHAVRAPLPRWETFGGPGAGEGLSDDWRLVFDPATWQCCRFSREATYLLGEAIWNRTTLTSPMGLEP